MLSMGDVRLSAPMLRLVGSLTLTAIIGLILYAGRRGRMLHLGRMSLPLPPASRIFCQIGIGVIDLAAASAALFVLIPGVDLHAWPAFFLGYALAIVAVLLTHVPGGVGVFELVMLAALPGVDRRNWSPRCSPIGWSIIFCRC
ncbi:hypothetical protein ACFSUK_31285 [Sphingobium scionense]